MAEQAEAQPGRSNGYDPKIALAFVERIERLEEEKAEKAQEYASDIKVVKLEASDAGIQTKTLNEVIKERKARRKMGKEAWNDFQTEIDMLKHALGEFANTPLGNAALQAAE